MFALFFYCALSIPIVVAAKATDKQVRKHSMILFIVYIVGYVPYIFSCMNCTVIE